MYVRPEADTNFSPDDSRAFPSSPRDKAIIFFNRVARHNQVVQKKSEKIDWRMQPLHVFKAVMVTW